MSSLRDLDPSGVVGRGEQRPRICALPAYESSETAEKALDFLDLIGFSLDPWQEFVLSESLGQQRDGSWSMFEVALVVARQNGKSELLAARQLVGLFVLHEQLIIHTAQQFDTAKEVFRRVEDVIENEPMLKRRVDLNRGRVGKWANGQEGIELLDKCRLRYRARGTGGGGRGFTADCLMFDEAMILAESIVGSVLPLLSSVPFPQVWYAGSAVDREIHEHGVVLSRLRERGLAGTDPSLMYVEWSAPGDDPDAVTDEEFASPVSRSQANPAYELRITDEYITREQRAMPRRSFAVERLGVGAWVDTSADSDRVIGREQWAACAETNDQNRIRSNVTFAIDTDPDQIWASVAVAGLRSDGLSQVAVVEHARTTNWILELCVGLQREHQGAQFALHKRGPAANLIDDLSAAGLSVIPVSTQDYVDAYADFVADAAAERLRYPFPQGDLDDALDAATKRLVGERPLWDRKSSSGADISPLVAATLALWASRHRPEEPNLDRAVYFF